MNLEIFKPGTHTTMHGESLTFTEEEMKASAEAYDPAVFRAPLVVGHPKTDDPAYGWVSSLAFNGVLTADPEQVEPQFAGLVNDGRFPKISAAFFRPDSPSNPKPGVWYLRHVGFLGAAAPAVKGLKEASFSDDADGIVTIEFAEADFQNRWVLSRALRNLRDWMLDRFGAEDADKVVPDWMARDAEEASREPENMPTPSFADPTDPNEPEEPIVDPSKDKHKQVEAEFAERESELQSRQAELDARAKALEEQEAKAREKELANFADQLVEEGKLLPREKEGAVAFMASLDDDSTVSFADGDQTVKKAGSTWFREFLQGLPERVDFAERGADTGEEETTASFAAPQGYAVDSSRLELHNKALAYQAQHNCDYNTALSAVG